MKNNKNKIVGIDVYHNILWSKYKGGVFSKLSEINDCDSNRFKLNFYQIAETEGDRAGLSDVDLSYHTYNYKLLFKGRYSKIPLMSLCLTLFSCVFNSDAELILLPGYHRLEFFFMLLAAILRRKKVAVFCDSTSYDHPRSFLRAIFKFLFFKNCDGFFGYGVRSREYLISLGANPDHIAFRCQAAALPHGYDREAALKARIAKATAADSPRFLYVGRLSPEKSLDVLLHAFSLFLNKSSAATLILVGAGPSLTELRVLAVSLNIEKSVVFAGSMDVEELSDEYLRATCFVLPSRSEPWGLVVNEALSYGCPVIVSFNCGCVPELVLDGNTGFVFRTGDVLDLERKLEMACVKFSDVKATGIECIELIKKFSPERAASQILEGCRSILSRKALTQ